jgi:NTE family protein
LAGDFSTLSPDEPYVALALSGGGSRAIAFHLGCLRALNDLGVLQKTRVMSTVSGGSVIGALYAYGDHASFEDFDKHVVSLLKRGLQWQLLQTALFGAQLPKILATLVISGGASCLTALLRSFLGLVRLTSGWSPTRFLSRLSALEEGLPFWGSLTTAFETLLARDLFGEARMQDVKIPPLEIIINACDLRTGTAFRFGSKTSGGWRYGRVVNGTSLSVAKAVAASAAFPALLPPLIQSFDFDRRGKVERHTLSLSDGGVYDNLGLTAIEPNRDSTFSVHVHSPTHIISLNAGPGQFPMGGKAFWFAGRLVRSFDAIYRKAQDAAYRRLHDFYSSGQIKGFALIYLGQNDASLPVEPPDLVRRDEVRNYPTDFARMSPRDIDLLTGRGEQLTRLLVSRYLPNL